jgi:hypothetical protein
MKSLGEIEAEVERLAAMIGAGKGMLPTYGSSNGTGTPHIEVDARLYHYVSAERGAEFDRWSTADLDELLYAVFRSVTFDMACKYELHHRIAGQDFRRMLFEKQMELMSVLSQGWAGRLSREKKKLLEVFPFDDAATTRAELAKQLRNQGNSAEEAWRAACEKYPEPARGSVEDGRKLELQFRKRD